MCMRAERVAFYEWLLRKVQATQAKYPGNDEKALQEISKVLDGATSEEGQKRSGFGTKVIQASGNTMAGLLEYVRQLEPIYRELEQVSALPYAEYQPAIDAFAARVAEHPNLFAHEFLPPIIKVRLKEFRALAWLAMLRTAYQIRVDSANGLNAIQDPFGTGPFDYSRFALDGVERGFKLQSELAVPDFPPALIFAEKGGPAFYVDGPKIGQKLQ